MENQIEIWKDIEDCEGLYQVSSLGRVKSFKGLKERILSNGLNRGGYAYVILTLKGELKSKLIHRLVASAFLGKNNSYVNHKDCNRANNKVKNLEYITHRDNLIHGNKSKNKSSKYAGVSWYKRDSKWVSQIGLNNKVKYLGLFDTELEAYNAYLKALSENEIDSKYA